MDLLQLEYFKKVAELEHITRASEELHIAQPSLSRTISNLENELGVKLFDRRGKNIYLNAYGKAVLEHTKIILHEIKNIDTHIDELKNIKNSSVSVSVRAASKLLPKLIMDFKARHPEAKIKMIQQESNPSADDDCDISIYSSIYPHSDTNVATLIEEDILLALPVENPLSCKKSIELSEVADEEFICLQKGRSLREITDIYCSMAGFSPNIVLESDNPDTVRELIRAGIGISFIPTITWGGISDSVISFLPISFPVCKRYIQLKWKSDSYLSQAAVLFKNFVIEYFMNVNMEYNKVK